MGDSGFTNLVTVGEGVGSCQRAVVSLLRDVYNGEVASSVASAGEGGGGYRFSKLCDAVTSLFGTPQGGSGGCCYVQDGCGDVSGCNASDVAVERARLRRCCIQLCSEADVSVGGGVGENAKGDLHGGVGADDDNTPCVVQDRGVGGSSCDGSRGVEGASSVGFGAIAAGRGKWAASNKRKRDRKNARRVDVGDGVRGSESLNVREVVEPRVGMRGSSHQAGTRTFHGSCETVVSQSSCPSYNAALSDAEKEAKESLARRRAAENAVAEKLARMKLASLQDEKRCQEYADLKRSRIVQWTNEAVAKSQQSLEKCKSIDPGSSNSQADIRAQALELDHVKKELQNVMAVFMMEGPFEERMAALQQLENRETTSEFIRAQAECWAEMRPCSVDPGSDDVKLDVPYKPNRFRVLRNSELDSDMRL